jgi:adenylyltransferase/sulfurtransferase
VDITRYLPQAIMPEIGPEGQQKIADAKVLVVGAGGLGCPALLYLTALGVGTIGVIDNDTISRSNLHRQILFTEKEIGLSKDVIAQQKLQAMNSETTIHAYNERLTNENAATLIAGYDIIVDCSDNIDTRYVIDACTFSVQKPFVYAGIRKFEGQVSVFNYKGSISFTNAFPDKERFETELDCATAGIVGFTAGLVACLQVNEVLKIILDKETLAGHMLSVDLETMVMKKWKLNQ